MANNNIEPIPVLEPEKTSLKDLYSEIERLFDFFNEKLYDSKLKKPVITIQSGAEGKRKSAGWFASNRWQFNRKKKLHEINISAEVLRAKTSNKIPEIACTLLHEMVHLSNFQNKIEDVSSNGLHLVKTFGKLAKEKGLEIEVIRKYPQVITPRLSPLGEKLYREFGFNEKLLNKYRIDYKSLLTGTQTGGSESGDEKPVKNPKLKNLYCPHCDMKAYIPFKSPKTLLCMDCMTILQENGKVFPLAA